MSIGQVGTWRRAPGGAWMVYASHGVLSEALAEGEPIMVRSAEGNHSEIRIEHVTAPDFDGFAYGWPVGTRASTFSKTEVAPVARHAVRQPLGGPRRTREYKRLHKRGGARY